MPEVSPGTDGESGRLTAGAKIVRADWFFRWTILPYSHCFGLAAFAFHLDHESKKIGLDAHNPGLRGWLDLENDQVLIDPLFGAMQIENTISPLSGIHIFDDGRVSADTPKSGTRDSIETTFDALRPHARQQTQRAFLHAIILEALEIRGRKLNPLSDKVPIDHGSFFAGMSFDRNAAFMELDGARLYDVECRIAPRLKPLDVGGERSDPLHNQSAAAKTRAAEVAIDGLWPQGVPNSLTAKERYRAIVGYLEERKLSVPSERTVRRALKHQ